MNQAVQVDRSGVAVGFIISPEQEEAESFVARCRAEGLTPRLVRTGYEVETPSILAGQTVRQPVQYLDTVSMDALHEDMLVWLRTFPSTPLGGGRRLADWRARKGFAPPIWAWLGPLAPYIQVCLRAIRLTSRVIASERPVAWAFIGGGGDLDWQTPLIRQVITTSVPWASCWNHERRANSIEARAVSWRRAVETRLDAMVPLAWLRSLPAYRKALLRLNDYAHAIATKVEASDGHAVLVSRGERGTQWLRSPNAPPRLIDDYSEGYPDALADACAARNWRLTIIWEGSRPVIDGAGYSDWRPGQVYEMPTSAFAGMASRLRRTVTAIHLLAINRLMRQPGMRQAFLVDGIDIWKPNAAYLSRTLANLATLHTTQEDAWRRVLEGLKADVVVGGRLDGRPWINAAAARAGAKTASIKLGIGDEMALSLLSIRPDGAHESINTPDALLVWGEHQKRHIARRLPENASSVVAVGRSRNDTFAATPDVSQAAVRRSLGLNETGPVIVWGGTHRSRWGLWPSQRLGSAVMAPEAWLAALEALRDLAEERNGQVLIKPHPADDQEFIRGHAERLTGVCVLAAATGAHHNSTILSAADVFVSSVSSMFAEAVLVGTPGVNLWTPEINLIYEKARFELYSRIAAPALSLDQMMTTVSQLLDDAGARDAELTRATAALPDLFGKADGGNARRGAEWVLDFGASFRQTKRV